MNAWLDFKRLFGTILAYGKILRSRHRWWNRHCDRPNAGFSNPSLVNTHLRERCGRQNRAQPFWHFPDRHSSAGQQRHRASVSRRISYLVRGNLRSHPDQRPSKSVPVDLHPLHGRWQPRHSYPQLMVTRTAIFTTTGAATLTWSPEREGFIVGYDTASTNFLVSRNPYATALSHLSSGTQGVDEGDILMAMQYLSGMRMPIYKGEKLYINSNSGGTLALVIESSS